MMQWTLKVMLALIPWMVLAQEDCGQTFHLTPENPSVQLASAIPHESPITCYWIVSAPAGSGPLTVDCPIMDVKKTLGCRRTHFGVKIGGRWTKKCQSFSETIDSNTVNLRFISRYQNRGKYLRYECTVSYNPPTTTKALQTPPTCPTNQNPSTPPTKTPQPPQPLLPPPADACKCKRKRSTRIVGGEKTEQNKYPWQAMLMRQPANYHFCGGSVIHGEWVVTAAHCNVGLSPSDIKVVLGEHIKYYPEGTEEVFDVIEIYQHPDYASQSFDNDISLLRLNSSYQNSDNIAPVCLPLEGADVTGKVGTVTGWGTTRSGGVTTYTLMEVDIPLLTTGECRNYGLYLYIITDNMMCTYEPGKGPCQGDSGGPLVMEHNGFDILVGVVSWGIGCAQTDYPGVYAKVDNYIEWIQENTGITDFCRVEST